MRYFVYCTRIVPSLENLLEHTEHYYTAIFITKRSLLAKIHHQNTNVSLLFIRMWKDRCGGRSRLYAQIITLHPVILSAPSWNVLRKLEKIRHIVIVKGFQVGGVCIRKTILIWKIQLSRSINMRNNFQLKCLNGNIPIVFKLKDIVFWLIIICFLITDTKKEKKEQYQVNSISLTE